MDAISSMFKSILVYLLVVSCIWLPDVFWWLLREVGTGRDSDGGWVFMVSWCVRAIVFSSVCPGIKVGIFKFFYTKTSPGHVYQLQTQP